MSDPIKLLPVNLEGIDTGKERPKNAEFFWQKERLKPDSERLPGFALFSGFGPEGRHSLYLPQSKRKRTMKFVAGKPTIHYSGGAEFPPEIEKLRSRIISTGTDGGDIGNGMRRLLFPDLVLAEYSTALLLTQYNFTDEELHFIHSGPKWPEVIVIHAMGGEKAVQSIANIDVSPAEADADALGRMATTAILEGTEATAIESPPGLIEDVTEAIATGVVIVESDAPDFSLETD